MIGIEIEFLGVKSQSTTAQELGVNTESWTKLSKCPSKWVLTTDGSIKDSEGERAAYGFELVSPPLEKKVLMTEVRDLLKKLKKNQLASINSSCALHVHVGIEEFKKEDLEAIFVTYKTLEKELNAMFPKSRLENQDAEGKKYCENIDKITFDQFFNEDKIHRMKYYSIRKSLSTPTIEFRKHGATLNPIKIEYWIDIIQDIINWAIKNKSNSSSLTEATLSSVLLPKNLKYFHERKTSFSSTTRSKN